MSENMPKNYFTHGIRIQIEQTSTKIMDNLEAFVSEEESFFNPVHCGVLIAVVR